MLPDFEYCHGSDDTDLVITMKSVEVQKWFPKSIYQQIININTKHKIHKKTRLSVNEKNASTNMTLRY